MTLDKFNEYGLPTSAEDRLTGEEETVATLRNGVCNLTNGTDSSGGDSGPEKKSTPDKSRTGLISRLVGYDGTEVKKLGAAGYTLIRVEPKDGQTIEELVADFKKNQAIAITALPGNNGAIYALILTKDQSYLKANDNAHAINGDVYWNGATLINGTDESRDVFEMASGLKSGLAPHTTEAASSLEKLTPRQEVFMIALELNTSNDPNNLNLISFTKLVAELASKYELIIGYQQDNRAIILDANEKGGTIQLFSRELKAEYQETGTLRSTSHMGAIEVIGDEAKLLKESEAVNNLLTNLDQTAWSKHTVSQKTAEVLKERDPSVEIKTSKIDDQSLLTVDSIEDADLLRALAPKVYIATETGQVVVKFMRTRGEKTLIVTGPAGIGKSANVTAALSYLRRSDPKTIIVSAAGVDRNNLGEVYASTRSLLTEFSRTFQNFPDDCKAIGTQLNNAGLAALQEFVEHQHDPNYEANLEKLADQTAAIYDILAAQGFTVAKLADDFLRFGPEAAKFERRVRAKSKTYKLIITHRSDIEASDEEVPEGIRHMTKAIAFTQNGETTSRTVDAWVLNEINNAKKAGTETARSIPGSMIERLALKTGAKVSKEGEVAAIPLRLKRVIAKAMESGAIKVDQYGQCTFDQTNLATAEDALTEAGQTSEISQDQIRTLAEKHSLQGIMGIILALDGTEYEAAKFFLTPEMRVALEHCLKAEVAIIQGSGEMTIDPFWRAAIEAYAKNNPASSKIARANYGKLKTSIKTDPTALFKLAELAGNEVDTKEKITLATNAVKVALEKGDYAEAVGLAEFIETNQPIQSPEQQLRVAQAYCFAGVKSANARTKLMPLLTVNTHITEAAKTLLQLEAREALLARGGDRHSKLEAAIVQIGNRISMEVYKKISLFMKAIATPKNIDKANLTKIAEALDAEILQTVALLKQTEDPRRRNELNSLLVLAYSTLQRAHNELTRIDKTGVATVDNSKITEAIEKEPDGDQAKACTAAILAGELAIGKIPFARGLDVGGRIEAQVFTNLTRAKVLKGDNGSLERTLQTLETCWAKCSDREFIAFLIAQMAPTVEKSTEPVVRKFHANSTKTAFELHKVKISTARKGALSEAEFSIGYNYAETLYKLALERADEESTAPAEEGGQVDTTRKSTAQDIMATLEIADTKTLLTEAERIITDTEQGMTADLSSAYQAYVHDLKAKIKAAKQ